MGKGRGKGRRFIRKGSNEPITHTNRSILTVQLHRKKAAERCMCVKVQSTPLKWKKSGYAVCTYIPLVCAHSFPARFPWNYLIKSQANTKLPWLQLENPMWCGVEKKKNFFIMLAGLCVLKPKGISYDILNFAEKYDTSTPKKKNSYKWEWWNWQNIPTTFPNRRFYAALRQPAGKA